MNDPHRRDARQARAVRDLIVITLLALTAFGLCAWADAFDRLVLWYERRPDTWGLDKLMVAVFILPVAFGVFAWLRWRELSREVDAHKQTSDALRLQTERLQESHERLLVSEKLASLGRYTAGVAHEISNPLGACRAALVELDKLVGEYEAALGDSGVHQDDHREIVRDMRQAAHLADQAAERVAAIVHGIKEQSREATPADRVRFSAVTVIQESLLLVNHALRLGRCTVSFEPEFDVIELVGAPGRLAQVVTNLVTNAIDASAEQGGGPITLRLTRHADHVELRVSDQGIGIPPENQAQIFNSVFTTKPVGQGTGLGLPIVHEIVTREFGGTIDFVSQVGQGTTFTLRFPHPRET
jgi:signal transduction histidine kinase